MDEDVSEVDDIVLNERNCPDINTKCGSLRTYGDIRADYARFVQLGGKKENAKICRSTINPPLFESQPDDIPAIEKCPLPELHLLQCFVNLLFWDSLVKDFGREKALEWPKALNLVSKSYHGDVLEVNTCHKLLKNPDAMTEINDVPYIKLLPYICACKAMDKLVQNAFGNKLQGDVSTSTQELVRVMIGVNLSETLKFHCIVNHIGQCLEFLNGKGLGQSNQERASTEFSKRFGRSIK